LALLENRPEILKRKPLRSILRRRPTIILERPIVELLGLDPPEVALPAGVTEEEAVAVIAGTPWAKGWGEGIAKLAGYTPSTPEYHAQVERLSRFVARRLLGIA
jgi:hypothetical protein